MLLAAQLRITKGPQIILRVLNNFRKLCTTKAPHSNWDPTLTVPMINVTKPLVEGTLGKPGYFGQVTEFFRSYQPFRYYQCLVLIADATLFFQMF